MAFEVLVGGDKSYGIAETATWGTHIVDAGAVIKLNCEPFVIPDGFNVRESPKAYGTRQEVSANMTVDQKRVMPSVQVVTEGKLSEIPLFVAAFCQNITEAATTPFGKTATLPATQPDFTATNGGFTFGLIERDGARSKKVKDGVCKALNFTQKAGERLKLSADMLFRGGATIFTSSGTWTPGAQTYFHLEDLARFTINFGAGARLMQLKGWELSLAQQIVAVGHDGTGQFLTYGYSQRAHAFKLNVAKDSYYTEARAALLAGTLITVNIGWGNATAGTVLGDLDFTWTGKLTGDVTDDNDEELLGINLNGKLLAASESVSSVTIIVADGVDRVW